MTIDIETTGRGQFAAVRATLSEDFATQTARLQQLTAASDSAEAHNRAAMLTATRQNLDQISGALRRIADGTYGACVQCGSAIPPERLEILPHAQHCVPCKEKHHG
ncbi:TraR/DksA C4-type zinc finger protein [Actinoplanes sp. TRM 88003]|uniref:TraR/DksA C4-type zinc finger protein n=1 Tax=Paractinoplanes aksuensis TaxID=2939490 RepID=A0ABT1E4M0_9ACTN|nr:TraR/DksA C4-type zinc finger protein [Actinoplanes aksuensis]MCO8278063.1 TraR/DksA C4-type zinc finger protein [Actinoplanes aksuensis]